MSRFVLAVDQGTSSSRAILFDRQASIRGLGQRELPQHFPRPGWVEHDPGEIWSTQTAAIAAALQDAGATPADLVAVGKRTAVCMHRPVLPQLWDALGCPDRKLEPAEMVVLHHRSGTVLAVELHHVR